MMANSSGRLDDCRLTTFARWNRLACKRRLLGSILLCSLVLQRSRSLARPFRPFVPTLPVPTGQAQCASYGLSRSEQELALEDLMVVIEHSTPYRVCSLPLVRHPRAGAIRRPRLPMDTRPGPSNRCIRVLGEG